MGQYRSDFLTPDGVSVAIKMTPALGENHHVVLLVYGSHGVFVNPQHFIDITAEKEVQMAIAMFDGTIIALTPRSAGIFFNQLIMGQDEPNKLSSSLRSVVRKGNWIGVATTPRLGFIQYLKSRRIMICAIVTIASLPISILTICLLLKRPSLQSELKEALRNHEFQVHYQPIIDARTGRCSGAEALLRWQRPEGLAVGPDIFIPIAERSGLIKPITDRLIEITVREMREMLVNDRELHIAINICAEDIETGRALSAIASAFERVGIRPEQIWLEVTEREILDIGPARHWLDEARKRGYVVAIDDFGTGYSSLQYLQQLPVDVLKIDRSFVATIGTESASSTVVSHIIDMAKSLRLTLVAEGVETQDQADYLAAHGVEFMQGWLYYQPLAAKELLDVVQARNG